MITELIALIGEEAFIKLSYVFGGSKIYISSTEETKQRMDVVLGGESADKHVIASYWGKGEVSRIEYFINTIMKFTALFVIPAGFLIGFLGRDIIILIFGGEFMPAVLPLQILLVGAVFGAIRASTGTALSSTAYVNIVFKLTLINVIANIIMNFLLIPRLGITGAAIATSVTYAIAASTSLYFTQRLLKVRIQLRWFAKLFALSGFLAAANYGLGLILNRYICISLTMTVLLFVLVKYFISADDFALIRRAISRK